MKHIYTLEFWRDIEGYEGLYQISNTGQVKSVKRNKILKPHITSGYFRVCLCKENKKRNFSIHRLVAEAFLPNEEGLAEVDHINGDRKDNRVANLQWVSREENNRKRNTGWGQPRRVICIETGEIYESLNDAARAINRKVQAMSRHLSGKYQTCAGLHFKYYD